jgi:hypothetical protein
VAFSTITVSTRSIQDFTALPFFNELNILQKNKKSWLLPQLATSTIGVNIRLFTQNIENKNCNAKLPDVKKITEMREFFAVKLQAIANHRKCRQ